MSALCCTVQQRHGTRGVVEVVKTLNRIRWVTFSVKLVSASIAGGATGVGATLSMGRLHVGTIPPRRFISSLGPSDASVDKGRPRLHREAAFS